jgi:Protein of unknown function (DUF4238)
MGHHYVPQQYLRNFQAPERHEFIWVHDKEKVTASLAAIKNVAQIRRFYSQETEDRLAREVETPANRVIDKLLKDEKISSAERMQLAIYIGTMHRRVPSERRRTQEMAPGIVREFFETLRSEIPVAAAVNWLRSVCENWWTLRKSL